MQYEGRYVGIFKIAVPAENKPAFYKVSKQLVAGEDNNFVHIKPLLQA